MSGSFFDTPFDSSKVDPAVAFKPLPNGDYLVMVKEGKSAPTKAGGEMLHLVLKALEGQYKGRELHWRINVKNANPSCVEMGMKQVGTPVALHTARP